MRVCGALRSRRLRLRVRDHPHTPFSCELVWAITNRAAHEESGKGGSGGATEAEPRTGRQPVSDVNRRERQECVCVREREIRIRSHTQRQEKKGGEARADKKRKASRPISAKESGREIRRRDQGRSGSYAVRNTRSRRRRNAGSVRFSERDGGCLRLSGRLALACQRVAYESVLVPAAAVEGRGGARPRSGHYRD